MCIYSALFMRFAWMVKPRNMLLLYCHASNECVQQTQFWRWYLWRQANPEATSKATGGGH